MHNLSTLEYVSPQKQRDKALECLEVYAPIAHRLGMRTVKEYMEDVSLKYLDPVAYHEIEENLEARSTRRKQFVESTKELIRSRVEPLIPGVYIEGRVKSINGIYRKMFIQGKSFDEIYDVFALRNRMAGFFAYMAAPALGTLTVTSAAGTASGDTLVTVTGAGVGTYGTSLVYATAASALPQTYGTAPTGGTFKPLVLTNGQANISGLTASQRITVAQVNDQTGGVIASGNAVIVTNS